MDEFSDEYWKAHGFKKVFIPQLNAYGWAKQIETNKSISEITDMVILEAMLEMCVEEEEYELATEIRDRIEELKYENDRTKI